MVVCTKTVDTTVRQAFGKQNVTFTSIENIVKFFALDPALSSPTRDAYIVSTADLRNARIRDAFMQAAAAKHPGNIIILIAKSSKENFTEGCGIDRVLVKPKAEVLAQVMKQFVAELEEKSERVNAAFEEKITPIEDFDLPEEEPVADIEEVEDDFSQFDIPPVEEEEIVPVVEELPVVETRQEKVVEEAPEGSDLIDRINKCQRVADLAELTRQLNAQEVVKELALSNRQYVVVEERLKALEEKIYSIFVDPALSAEKKMEAAHALLVDKDYFRTQNNTVLEQRVEAILDLITSKTTELVSARLADLDKAILNTKTSGGKVDYARVSAIADERARILLDIATESAAVEEIYERTDKFAATVISDIAADTSNLTGNPLVDARLRLHHDTIISSQSLDSIEGILVTCDKNSEEFKASLHSLKVMNRKLLKLIDLDKELIEAMAHVVELLHANKVEDTVVANTLLKSSLRVFIAKDGDGKTVIPYFLSQRKSRQNANVLYVDITGRSKLSEYTDDFMTLKDFYRNPCEKDFCAVVGTPSNDAETGQKLLATLTKAADYYRVINVVMTPQQVELFKAIAADVLVVNYIVCPNRASLQFYKEFLKETRMENVAQRVILNKCDIPIRPLLEELDVIEDLDVHVVRVPYIPQIVECSLRKIAPHTVPTICEQMNEVTKVC